MNKLNEVITNKTKKTTFYCDACKKRHRISIPRSLFNSKHFPVSYAYIHGKPQVIAILYIDKRGTVRGVENPKEVGIRQDQLTLILNKSKNKIFSKIPKEKIVAFILKEDYKIKKIYKKPNHKTKIKFSVFNEMIEISEKFIDSGESFNEFYIKYNDLWICGMKMFESQFLLTVDGSIEIDHLKFQMMALFESLQL